MDYPCGKFGDCSFSHFDSIVQTNRHTYVDECFAPETVVGVSNYRQLRGELYCYHNI